MRPGIQLRFDGQYKTAISDTRRLPETVTQTVLTESATTSTVASDKARLLAEIIYVNDDSIDLFPRAAHELRTADRHQINRDRSTEGGDVLRPANRNDCCRVIGHSSSAA
jgi:hypothetical protein